MLDDWREKLRRIRQDMTQQGMKGKQKKPPQKRSMVHASDAPKPKTARTQEGSVDAVQPRSHKASAGPQLPPEPDRGEGQTFNIGIDVGTSTTKVCFRPPGASTEVFVISLGSEDTALCPSTVAVEGGCLYFGSEAEERARGSGAQVFRQFKVCVACEVSLKPEVPTSSCRCKRMSDTSAGSAVFALSSVEESVLASDLLIFFLSWAMGEGRRRLPNDLTGGRLPRTTYSISAPLDQFDAGSELNGAYARVVFHAWRLSGAIRQGIGLKEAFSWIVGVQRVPLPPEEERTIELCPESGAIAAGYAMSTEEEGLYGVIDIGAWTSEMSFFRLTQVGRQTTGRWARSFYAARSHRVAANQIDERCRNHVIQLYDCSDPAPVASAERIRELREASVFGTEAIRVYSDRKEMCPRESALRFAQDLVAEDVRRRFVDTLGEAYEKEKLESRWRKKLQVLFAGGGSLDPVLRSGIEHPFIKQAEVVPEPRDLGSLSPSGDYRRFLVAYGLAHGSSRWPRDFLPSEVLPLRPSRRVLPTSEELGYDDP